jgi:hypothetical protein
MTARTKTALKAFFETGDVPTETQFSDLIDTFVSLLESSGFQVTAVQDSNIDNVIVANACTIDLDAGNHQSVSLAAATGPVTLTLVAPSGPTSGTIIILQDDPVRDIIWVAGAGITAGVWLGTETNWAGDTASKRRIVSWRFDGTDVLLVPTGEETATF